MAVLLETSIGDLVIDLKVDVAPKACENFVKLCKMKYYNNCLFFSVQKDFIAQTGDPTNTGRGGACMDAKIPGRGNKHFRDEIRPTVKHTVRGTVAMANEKPHANGSAFYITLRKTIETLDGKHTIFGSIAEGLDVLDKINNTMVDEKSAPYQNIRIWHTEVLEDPFPDPEGLEALIPPKSPEVIKDEVFKEIEDEQDEADLQERMATTLAKSQATTLELLHDLPDADIAPPDTDLFVAKLNPVTQDGDLELIFSRFGPIKSCEIVRDWKTGDSLQYGFVIFENAKDCEQAYFKMHDCVIDDRRILVNFSQSVAKLWNKWKTNSRMSADDVKGGAEQQGTGRTKGKGKGKGKGKPFEKSEEICGDFRRGNCTRGDSCRFKHEVPPKPADSETKPRGRDDRGRDDRGRDDRGRDDRRGGDRGAARSRSRDRDRRDRDRRDRDRDR
eukprot:TRINITY_DN9360_c3_g1_i2.p1 TRINITY_DN9360_c3_g1~~TRINITY_DN9360_c3_g1_i2.p1  ORF type:complete len:444 (-),score=88.55 TRINITY_DN9360_c3_g1_i2:77-1408(-)